MNTSLTMEMDEKGMYCLFWYGKLIGKGKTMSVATKNASKYFKGQNL